jgi:hypothetical protein
MNYVSKIFINLAVEKVGVNVPLYHGTKHMSTAK